jgi:hypothetical protein
MRPTLEVLMRLSILAAVVSLAGLSSLFACTATGTKTIIDDTPDGGKTSSSNGTSPTPGSSSSSSSSGGGGTICDQVCAKAASANCSGQSTCVKDCESQQSQVPAGCKTQLDDALQCAASRATGFKCSSSGKATAQGCDTEGNALVQCMMNGGGSSSGGSSSGGGGNCGNITTGVAACDTCVTSNCCAQNAACGNDCFAILQCFQNCTDNACYTQCENQHPAGVSQEQALLSCVSSNCSSVCQ